MKIWGKMSLVILNVKKTEFHPFSEKYILEKTIGVSQVDPPKPF